MLPCLYHSSRNRKDSYINIDLEKFFIKANFSLKFKASPETSKGPRVQSSSTDHPASTEEAAHHPSAQRLLQKKQSFPTPAASISMD